MWTKRRSDANEPFLIFSPWCPSDRVQHRLALPIINLVPPTVPSCPPPPPPKKNYKQKHGLGFSLDYCDTQNTSDLELKQCLHTTWDPLLLHYYVSPKNLAPFRTLPQLFSTVSQPMSETFKTVIWTHCHCYKGPRFDSISMTHRHFYFHFIIFILMSQTQIDMVFFF